MLELSKIKYTEKPDTFRPNCTEIVGTLQMHGGITVDNNEKIPHETVKAQIATRIWWLAYGELREPLLALQAYAKINVRPQDRQRVMELCEQINALMSPKSPNVKL